MGKSPKRRLTTIVAADVFGYSRLIAADEEGTLAVLSRHRSELIDPKISEHDGRIANTAGDSLLIEFQSVVEALRFAISMQHGVSIRNAGIPDERKVVFRVGINLGDVIEQDGDLLGDGVNVAARIEALANPGGINISAAARDQIGEKIEVEFDDLGEQSLKNIPKPVRVYRVKLDATAIQRRSPSRNTLTNRFATIGLLTLLIGVSLWWAKPWGLFKDLTIVSQVIQSSEKVNRSTVAVLPFNNISDDREQEYFSDGITEDLITDLSKVSGLLVIARNSTFAYKGQSPDIRKVGKELNARYVVEGSVRKAGGRVRINAQLIDANTGNHLWADRYDSEIKDIFTLQDEVVAKIIASLKVTLTPDEQRRLALKETQNLEAYDLYLKARRQVSFFNVEGNEEALRLLDQVIQLDPKFAKAHATLALTYSQQAQNGWETNSNSAAHMALKAAEKSVELDPELPQAHWSLAHVLARPPFRQHEHALESLRRTVELDPSYADGHAYLANVMFFVGRAEEALGIVDTAMRINPHYPFWYIFLRGRCLYMLGRYEDAVPNFLSAAKRNPNVSWPRRWLVATYGHLNLLEDAKWELSELESLGQPLTIKIVRERSPIVHKPYLKSYIDGLKKAGVLEE